jgi:hypothetical protein
VTVSASYGGVSRTALLIVMIPPLVINALTVSNITDQGASISWTTNRPSDTEVEYGITTAYGNLFSNKSPSLSHQVNLNGLAPGTIHHFKVKSTDNVGSGAASGDYTFTTTGTNLPPTVSVTASTNCGTPPLNVNFSATGVDPEGYALTYNWVLGEGVERSGAKVSYTYWSPGNFSARVTVTDNGGVSVSKSVAIIVPPLPVTAMGMRYYVSTAGSDSNPGTEALPFRTIQKAVDIINPGDTVLVDDGVYTMGTPSPACSSDTAVVCVTRGGTPNNWVVIKSKNKWGAKIDGQNNRVQNGFRFPTSAASFIRIEGFDVYGMGNNGSASGFEIFGGSHDLQIVGNKIHDIGKLCTDTLNGNVGIYINQNNVLVDGNVIHDIGRFGPGEQGCAPTSQNWQNHDHGVYHSRGDDVTIRNNVFYNLQRGWGIQAYPSVRARSLIVNNTFSGPFPDRMGHIIIAGSGMLDSKIVNNIFHKPTDAAIYIDPINFVNTIVSNNLTTASALTTRTPPPGFIVMNNMLDTDPKFANASAFDFRLQPGSPAIDTGMSLPEVVSDIGGCERRPQGRGFDIGAYEYLTGSSQVSSLLNSPFSIFRFLSCQCGAGW